MSLRHNKVEMISRITPLSIASELTQCLFDTIVTKHDIKKENTDTNGSTCIISRTLVGEVSFTIV